MALNRWLGLVMVLVMSLGLAACDAIGTIFKTGVWAGAIMIVLVLAAVGFVALKIRG